RRHTRWPRDWSSDVCSSDLELVETLAKLQPRLYSISSSLKAHPEEVHFTIDIVHYESRGRMRKGVCSTFLAERAEKVPVPVFPRSEERRVGKECSARSGRGW